MNFKQYLGFTKEAWLFGMKVAGLVFTTIYVGIAIATGYQNQSIAEAIEIFILCFLLGNAFALSMCFVLIYTAYRQAKSTIKFYNLIPEEIREEFGLILIEKSRNPKHDLLEFTILDEKSETPVLYSYKNKLIGITIINRLDHLSNTHNAMLDIRKKYKKEKIILTVNGLRKNMKRKEWQSITAEKIYEIINELITISKKEGLELIRRDVSEEDTVD